MSHYNVSAALILLILTSLHILKMYSSSDVDVISYHESFPAVMAQKYKDWDLCI